jgi:hypothetical protein
MTILAGRWDIDYVAKRVFRVVATSPTITDTTLALYSALQDEFDEPAQMDDQVPMSAQTPTAFTMINGWFMDDVSTQFLTGGALTTSGWGAGVIVSISYDTNAGVALQASDIGLTITGTTTTDTGVILAFDERFGTELGVMYIRATVPLTDIFDNTTEAWTVGGSSAAGIMSVTYEATQARTGNSLWPNIFALGTLVDETELYVIQDNVKLAAWWPKGFIDILVRTTEQGTETDSGFITVGARQFGALYDHFIIDVSAGGRQPVPLSTGNDGNNVDGHREMVLTVAAGLFEVGDIIEDDTPDALTVRGLVTSVAGSNPNITLQYIVLGDLTDFSAATGTFNGVAPSTGTGTAVNPTSVNQAALGTPPTLVFANTDASLGAGEPLAPYSIQWDTNQNTMTDFYGFLKLVTKRGAGASGVVETASAAQAGTDPTITGEAYIGNELQAQYGTQTGTFVEGDQIFFFSAGDVLLAQGTVVADHDDTGTGDVIVRNFQTLASGTITKCADLPVADTGNFAAVTSTRGIAPVKTSPFGTLAGGVFFGAPGVLVTDILAAENQNFQLIDDDGTTRNPPITVNVTVTGTLSDDRVSVHVLDNPLATPGFIVRNTFTMTVAAATENGIGDSNAEIDASIPNDQPADGWIMVVDDSASAAGVEHRLQYDSFTGQIFTLTPITPAGAALHDGASGSATLLEDADALFITNGVKVGHIVRNVTDANGFGVVVTLTESAITMTPLTGGTGDTWEVGDAYEINTIPVDFTTSDTAYVPLILDETGGTSIVSGDMTFIGSRDLMIRVRNGGSSDPITPFETGAALGSSNLEIAAIRTPDGIAT